MDAKALAAEQFDYVVAFRRDLHQHPEPSYEEFRTTEKIAAALDEMGIPYRKFDPTGLIGEIKGGKPGKTVAIRADIDALSIGEKSGVPFASLNEGFMHACGHDTHVAMLLGAARALNGIKDQLEGTVKLLFQPAEEVASGARHILKQGALDGIDMIFGAHIFTQVPVGYIGYGDGASTSAADTFKITVHGKACHGANPNEGADATVAAAAIIMNLQTVASREIDPLEKVVVTVGTIQSGSRFNIVSGEAVMEGTCRSFSRDVHNKLEGILERIATKTAEAFRCTATLEFEQVTEVLINDSSATEYMKQAAAKVAVSPELVSSMPPVMGAEDFAEYSARIKAGFFGLGAGGTFPIHSDYMVVEEEAFKTGVAMHIQLAYNYLNGADLSL